MKQRTILPLILSSLLLASCSSTFVYNQLDWLVPWYLDDYVDLTRPQQEVFKLQLGEVLQWHRGAELGSYIELLDGVEKDLQQPVTAATVHAWGNAALAAWNRVEARTLPIVFALGEQLSDRQMADFVASLREQQLEMEDEYLSRKDAEFVADNLENFEENLSTLLGRLSAEQSQLLGEAAQGLQRYDSIWLEERKQWLQELEGYLQREPHWQQAVTTALESQREARSANSGEAWHNQQLINQTIAAVLNMRSAKQNLHLLAEIENYRSDLRALQADAESAAQQES